MKTNTSISQKLELNPILGLGLLKRFLITLKTYFTTGSISLITT
ncbi:hypothetical protein [Chryseobacterium sp. T16E-39]|nr:hypothetical protein [Chryseobacterium sp. T16E-39]